MRKYVVLTDTCCDLDKGIREKYDIKYVCMRYVVDGVDYEGDIDWQRISAHEFFDLMRAGKRITTAQVPQYVYEEFFRSAVKDGYDVLYIGCSSALSAGIKSSRIVSEEVLKDYPEAKIICIDSLRSCHALGLLTITAAENRNAGMSIEENAKWIEENKHTINMEATVDSLVYLKRAGRVSAVSAFFGEILSIKPVIIADAIGQNFAIEKTRGRKASLKRIAKRVAESFVEVPHQKVFISHADCIEDAEYLRELVKAELNKDIEIPIGYVGSCIGASVGPGMVGVFFYGKEVTINKGLERE